MPVTIEILGTKEAADMLSKVDKEVEANVSEAVMRAAFLLESEAKHVVHVVTGRLKASIHTQRIDKFAARVSDNVEYGVMEEARGGEHAFMTIAVENKGEEAQEIISEAVDKAVREA